LHTPYRSQSDTTNNVIPLKKTDKNPHHLTSEKHLFGQFLQAPLLYSLGICLSSTNYHLKENILAALSSVKLGTKYAYMTNIREVLAVNLKKHRQARGWSQAKLAEKVGTSTQYIGTLEIKGKFPSSEMVHKLAIALGIDPTELFYKEIDPETVLRNSQKAAIEDIGEAVTQLVTDFFTERVRKLDGENEE
jgi:transcriptional regulator with XRE-family HTH domain